MPAVNKPLETAYLNGVFLPLAEASVPVLDRGLLFADAVYEVIPVYAGRPYALAEHLQRLAHSLAALAIVNPLDAAAWTALLSDLIARNGSGDCSVYLQITRGSAARRDHRPASAGAPTVIAFCQARAAPDAALFEQGVQAITQADTRWSRCDIKSTALLANVLLAGAAADAGAAEAILLRDGFVTEGASSNVFVVVNGLLTTPPLSPAILAGITRAKLLGLAAAHGIDYREAAIAAADLAGADEIWLTSSTREIYPVTVLDGAAVGGGAPGPLWHRLRGLLQADTAGGHC